MAAALFHGRRFYLTRAMAPQQRQQVRKLIEERGGEVTTNLRGAIQLVDQEHLDPRQEWVSIDFVLDSVARGALQDLSEYMGQELAPASPQQEEEQQQEKRRSQASRGRRQKRIKYSAEDDARMLVYLQSNFGRLNTSMQSVPLSVWENAARKKVTNHTGQSMHERYRKQLRAKTPAERREIIAKGLKRAKARTTGSDEKEEDEEVEDIEDEMEDKEDEPGPAATPAPTATPAATMEQPQSSPPATAAQAPTPPVARNTSNQAPQAARPDREPAPIHNSSDSSPEDEEEGDTRGKKRLRRTTHEKEPVRPNGAPPSAPSESAVVSSPRRRLRRHSSPMLPLGRPPLHRDSNRRRTLGMVTRSSTKGIDIKSPVPPPCLSSDEEKEQEEQEQEGEEEKQVDVPTQASNTGDARGERGVFFSSVWADAFADPSNRRRLHDLFEPAAVSSPTRTSRVPEPPAESPPPSASRAVSASADLAYPVPPPAAPGSPPGVRATPERQHRSPGSDATATPQTTQKHSLSDAGYEQQTPPVSEPPAEAEQTSPESEPAMEVEYSTEQELDVQLTRIGFETNASPKAVLHALYYSSGNYATAKAFLKGQSPAGMWSPQDDLLLANLTSRSTTKAHVKAAARAGAFAAMRVQRSVDDILARIRYLL